jgi:hypothetical protein
MDAAIQQSTKVEKSKMKDIFATDWIGRIAYVTGVVLFFFGAFFSRTGDYWLELFALLVLILNVASENSKRWTKLQNFLESEFKD